MPTREPNRGATEGRAEGVRRESLRIAGARVATEAESEVFNPYNGALVGRVAGASVQDVRRALESPGAFRARRTRYARYRICDRAAEALRARTEHIDNL